ncbi:cupredoxin domain-containing protein [Sphaerotilaceae bacterium SBD11-9]
MNSHHTASRAAIAVAILTLAHTAFAGGNAADGHSHSHANSIGVPGKAGTVSRTVQVDMTDAMRFIPANVAVKQGETIRFVVKNSGQVKHEFVLGTEKELKDHYEVMKKFPEMEHADPNMVTVAPGKTGEVIWQFTKSGSVDFACLQPGHYDAGMKGAVKVAGGKAAARPATTTDGKTDHKH